MSFEKNQSMHPETTSTLEERSFETSHHLRTRESAQQYLTEVYTGLRDQENRLEDVMRTFVATHDDWSIHQEGSETGIDTVLSGPNKEALRIWMTSEHAEAFSRRPDGTIPQLRDALLSEATGFRLETFSADVLRYLTRRAPRKTPLISVVRQTHSAIPVRERRFGHTPYLKDRMDEFFQNGDSTVRFVPLVAPDPAVLGAKDADAIITQATIQRARLVSERETHHEEYRALSEDLIHDFDLTEAQREQIRRRLLAIQAINGHVSSHLNWHYVIPKGMDRERALEFDTTWDTDTITSIESQLSNNPTLEIARQTIRTHTIAVQAMRSLTSSYTNR